MDREIDAAEKDTSMAAAAAVEVRAELEVLKQTMENAADSTQHQVMAHVP